MKIVAGLVAAFGAFCLFALVAKDWGCQSWHYELRSIKGVEMNHKVCDR